MSLLETTPAASWTAVAEAAEAGDTALAQACEFDCGDLTLPGGCGAISE